MNKLTDKVAVVTGASKGIGASIAEHLAAEGASVVVNYASSKSGTEVVAIGRIQGKTRKAAVPVDVPFAHVWTVREGYLQRLRAFTDTALLARALAKH